MQFPVVIHFGKSSLPLHAVLETAGFFIGFRYFLFLKKKQGDTIDSNTRTWILIGAIFGALIGSRLIGALEKPHELLTTKNTWQYIYTNKTVLGGFLGGLFGVELVKKLIGEKRSSGDLFTYPMILALIIGRIGCFSMGVYEETYGTPTTFFTGMNLGDGILRHPVSLYEIVFLIVLWIGLQQVEKRYVLTEGARFKIFMIAYIAYRFLQEFIKPSDIIVAGLSTIQLTAIAGLSYYYRYLIHPKKLLQANASTPLHLL
ncbi:MAG: diacylglyceryl transferase [Ferruginibacter sp.]|uniref:prolipoprotein diacylglyceryl transferase n=1 Tax=Ferruginibacter sp. TaxID=1940288 RepID=UPI0026588D84|nr:prolipoprotein diacylglyceryl transferase family protein [Ferruginibacter sp.]MDB5275082.1 diacylglyceryl transferase [Ferruginibacter sp.]